MSTRNTILTQLKTDLEDNLSSANGYNSDIAEVRRGIHVNSNFPIKPVVSFFCYKDIVVQHLQDKTYSRKLSVVLYGFADTDGFNDVDAIHNLADDLETFLDSTDWTYANDTIIGDLNIYEGGEDDKNSVFTLDIELFYIN